ncbi:unnamed protein product [Rotaria socialis]|uniref:DUF4590 domain-containing protein n=1 Tax=Rotaria socialis TaxID=392032 RepID=A0A821GXU4_9BILA|nr:unnamed protein product [Rotaria socialis]CAF3743083.1 unnamed protein product [Rotaria socialis]CAF4532764.1 unnamed protein product [Rotaria socialis]CAF4676572.1 unnamed protein product [Rotaria socialis]
MDYLLRRERLRLAKDIISQRIIEQAIDLERQCENDLRREFQSIIHDVQGIDRRRHTRSHSQTSGHRDNRQRLNTSDCYEESSRYRSGSLSQYHQRHHNHHNNSLSSSRECSLVTLTYRNSAAGKHGDEITILQNGRTVFKGCLSSGDQLTFKSKRYRNSSRIKLDFFINDLLEDRITTCCEHALTKTDGNHVFKVENIIGSKPCQECQSESDTSSSSLSTTPPTSRNKIPFNTSNNEQRHISSKTKQQTSKHTIDNTQKRKPPVSLNNGRRISENQTLRTETRLSEQSNLQESEKKKATLLAVPQADLEKTSSEGFTADVFELPDSESLISIQSGNNRQRQNSEPHPRDFLPILSSTDPESPPPTRAPPPKRIYGPPQLSTMLSVTDNLDSPFEISTDAHEETLDKPIRQKSESLNIQQQKGGCSDSDNDNNQNENHQSNEFVQFLRSISSNVENNQNEQRLQPTSSMSMNSTRDLPNVGDGTQLLLTRLGIIRQQQVEHTETSMGNAPRERGNVEYFILVYLNSTKPDDSIIKPLRSLVNFLKTFDDIDDCIAFINSISNEKVIFILSDVFSNSILPRIEDLQQIYAIYILNENDQNKQNLLNKNSKIKGFYTNINDVYKQISIDINQITRDLIAYMNISSNSSTPDPMFIYSQLISEIILDSDETEYAMKELVNFARQEYEGNSEELSIIDEFETDYEKHRAVWWFTRQCFLSKMLNKALRIPEADILFKFRLFIQDLYHQIENESISNTSLTVYLGQTIHQNDLEDLQKSLTNHGLLVFSQILFGSTDLSKAIQIAKNLPNLSEEYVPVVLHFDLSPNMKCANAYSLRYTVDDSNDILLNMGIIGRLTKVEKKGNNNENGVASIHLTLIKCENERSIQRMLETKRNEVKGAAPFVSLIKLMIMMNQQARAEQLVQMIFDDETVKSDPNLQGSIAASCHILGAACHTRGDFKRAAELFHLSLDTFLRFVPSDAVQLSPTYNNIGSMYFRQEEYTKAIEYHQKALDVQLHSHNPNLTAIASYSNNVGVVYLKQGKYSDAAKSFDRALKILQQLNESNNPDLASTYDNLGDAYVLQDKYDDALTYYSKALETQRVIEPRNPPALASFNNSIGNVYNKMHRYGDALVHFKRALEFQQEYLPATHPSFASLYNNIGSMYYRQEQYGDALPCYLKSLEIELMCLPENHPTIAVTHFNIATTYTGLGRFEDAILSTERSIEQLLKTLPTDHPEVIENRSYIDTIRRKQMLKGLFDTNTTNF